MSKDKVFHLIGWISDEHYADTALEIGVGNEAELLKLEKEAMSGRMRTEWCDIDFRERVKYTGKSDGNYPIVTIPGEDW